MNYDFVDNYTMKCRLYPNEEQKSRIQDALAAVRVYYNCTLFEMFTNHECTIEKQRKRKDGSSDNEVIHFPDLQKAQSAEWKKKLTDQHPVISCVPAGALMSKNGCIGADMKKSLGKNPIEYQKPAYYNSRHPRMSYTYQETCSKIEASENENVFYISLSKIGRCKVRGWNQNIRFNADGTVNFLDFCAIDKKKNITVTVNIDACGDHWICFKLQNVYKPMSKKISKEVGVDVGTKDLVILSDGTKFKNMRFKEKEYRHQRRINRKLSRRQGWANEEFREAHKKNPNLKPSNSYERTKIKLAMLGRKIERRRTNYNHNITRKIVEENGRIGIESLDVKGLQKNKYVSKALSDAAIGSILEQLKYKAKWHGREIVEADQYYPSTKRCSKCGYVKENLKLYPRNWKCPRCGSSHDIDVNAAINILHYAFYPALAE